MQTTEHQKKENQMGIQMQSSNSVVLLFPEQEGYPSGALDDDQTREWSSFISVPSERVKERRRAKVV